MTCNNYSIPEMLPSDGEERLCLRPEDLVGTPFQYFTTAGCAWENLETAKQVCGAWDACESVIKFESPRFSEEHSRYSPHVYVAIKQKLFTECINPNSTED